MKLTILMLLIASYITAQTPKIEYIYTSSGNRTMRKINPSPFRVGNKDSTDSAKEFSKIVMEEGISVYPNPTTGKITLSLNKFDATEKNSVSLIDLKGSELMSQPITQSNTEMDLSALKAGIYYFKVIKNNQELYYKVVKVD